MGRPTQAPDRVIAQLLKRLYPHNPDVVLGREARLIVAALTEAGYGFVCEAPPECPYCDCDLEVGDHAPDCGYVAEQALALSERGSR